NNLCMELGRRCPTDVDVGKWVANAVDREVYELTFKLLWSADLVSLPKSLYSCKSLNSLTLSHKILVDVPSSAASLSSLTTLVLDYVVYKDEDSLVRFLSSCSILERLTIKRNKKDDNVTTFSVKVPSLLYLDYANERRMPENIDAGETGSCLVIDAPALTDFRIHDTSGDSCFFSNEIPRLDFACVDVEFCPDDKLLRILSSALSIILFWTDPVVSSLSSIKFSRLKDCRLLSDEPNWMEPTILLLQNSPKLKSLMVYCVRFLLTPKFDELKKHSDSEPAISWSQPSSVPGCLSSQLEEFQWKSYLGREDEERFLTYVLANSKCLKTAVISIRPVFNLQVQEEMMLDLKDIPRVSTESQLVFTPDP
ncbi:hypothetical protein EUTSA_v10005273mg, partial [Eutrema salsugineum]